MKNGIYYYFKNSSCTGNCKDNDNWEFSQWCNFFASNGYCDLYADVKSNCEKSCGQCGAGGPEEGLGKSMHTVKY